MKTELSSTLLAGIAAALAFCANTGRAQSLSAWTADAGTACLTSGTVRLVVAAGQGQPVGTVFGGAGRTLYQGFLSGAVLFTNLDHDADGMCDETDPDNDNDGLTDMDELHGALFPVITATDVNDADSDADGAGDGAEAVMASNPLDADSLLRLTLIQMAQDGTVTLTWQAQAGVEYAVDWCTNLVSQQMTNPIPGTVTAMGGTAPWFDTSASKSFAGPAPTNAFFRVRVVP